MVDSIASLSLYFWLRTKEAKNLVICAPRERLKESAISTIEENPENEKVHGFLQRQCTSIVARSLSFQGANLMRSINDSCFSIIFTVLK